MYNLVCTVSSVLFYNHPLYTHACSKTSYWSKSLPQKLVLLSWNNASIIIHLKCWTKDPDVAVRLSTNACCQCKHLIGGTSLKLLPHREHVATPCSFADSCKMRLGWTRLAAFTKHSLQEQDCSLHKPAVAITYMCAKIGEIPLNTIGALDQKHKSQHSQRGLFGRSNGV